MIWNACLGAEQIKPIHETPWRVVEAQHILSTRDLVDNTEEHDMLELLLDKTKPAISSLKHYLIFSPFRYPPLHHGSRFGTTLEPSLWYGSIKLETAFAETAYYLWLFLSHTSANFDTIERNQTAFQTTIKTNQGIDLTIAPFDTYKDVISNKANYHESQQLGKAMRNQAIDAFIYYSARTTSTEKNIALFNDHPFSEKQTSYINHLQNWQCFGSKHLVEFYREDALGVKQHRFNFNDFFHENFGWQYCL